MTLRLQFLSLLCAICTGPTVAFACDYRLEERLTFSSDEFKSAVEIYESDAPSYLRSGAFATMLRTDEPMFGALLREGKKSADKDIQDSAVFCEVMRSNGFTVSAVGKPAQHSLNEGQLEQLTSYSKAPVVVSRHFEQGCLSTYKTREKGCNPTYHVSVSGGVVSFRSDRDTGTFTWVDGEYVGELTVSYGGPMYTMAAKLVIH